MTRGPLEVSTFEASHMPWPPPRGRAAVLDLVLDSYPPRELDPAGVGRIFARDVVITSPPLKPGGAFRHFFGLEGALQVFAEWRSVLPEIDVVPEQCLFADPHAIVVCRIVRRDGEHATAAWLCTERDGRISTMRGFRYASEALARLSALASGS